MTRGVSQYGHAFLSFYREEPPNVAIPTLIEYGYMQEDRAWQRVNEQGVNLLIGG